MKRLSVLLDDVAYLRSILKNTLYDPVQFGILSEIARVNGLVCLYTNSENGINVRDLQLMKKMRKTFFNLRIPLQNEAVQEAITHIPDMVTFIKIDPGDSQHVLPIDPVTDFEALEELLPSLQANNISISALIAPEISELKSISKLAVDYVEIDVRGFTEAQDINAELVTIDKIKSAAMAAGKLGIGVNCSGRIKYDHLSSLAQIPNLEDIIMGSQLIQRAFWVGVERAVSEALECIRLHEVN